MTEKRYIIEDNYAIVDTESMTSNGIPTKIFVAETPVEAVKISKELNEQDQEIQKYQDAFYKAHQQQQDTMKELSKIKKERDEAIFKQKTLEKWYTCPTCGYNNKEIEYLKSLKK